ncbi:MAG: hypothetical protein KF729_18440 [Sandaracinaceae bacterium]|nr:hypothetical protein [Sandaracinaceae bacterium]
MRSALLVQVACSVTLAAFGGCIVRVGFDPVGVAASAEGSWTIDGAPPTAASCGEVAYVRVRFFEGGEHRDHAGLVFECARGAFDTRPERVIAEGQWEVALVAIRADGSIVREGVHQTIETSEGHVELAALDLEGPG